MQRSWTLTCEAFLVTARPSMEKAMGRLFRVIRIHLGSSLSSYGAAAGTMKTMEQEGVKDGMQRRKGVKENE